MPWRTIEGETEAASTDPEIEVTIKGLFDKERFLNYLSHFIVFEETGGDTIAKKIAGYHQFHAVRAAVDATVKASRPDGDKRCGVIWHTQGSGKSLTMAFYAGGIIRRPEMRNPTLVVITDRNDLDDQLFGTFARCSQLLATNAGASARQGAPAQTPESCFGRRGVYHGAEVLSRR